VLPVVTNPDHKVPPPAPNQKPSPLGKRPTVVRADGCAVGIMDWPRKRSTVAEIARWAKNPTHSIFVQTRDLRCVDVDVDDPGVVARIASIIDRFGTFPQRLREGSARTVFAFRVAGPLARRKLTLPGGLGIVELLADDGGFVACGRHKSGAMQTWNTADGLPPTTFPQIEPAMLDEMWSALERELGAASSASAAGSVRESIRKESQARDPIEQRLHDLGLVIGERGDKVLVRCPWSDEHSSQGDETESVYYPPHTGRSPYPGYRCMHAHCASRTVADLRTFLGITSTSATVATPDEFDGAAADRFRVIPADEFADRPPINWRIKGLIPERGLVFVYGAPGSGKSFVVLDAVASIAAGETWNGRKVKAGRVVIVAAEGGAGFSTRLRAYERGDFNPSLDALSERLAIIAEPLSLAEPKDVKTLAAAIEASGGADVLVVDTLAAASPGVDENAGAEMGRVVDAVIKLCDQLGAVAIVVHHSGKDAARGLRGWSGLTGAADAILAVERIKKSDKQAESGEDKKPGNQSDTRVVRLEKSKDAGDSGVLPFRLEVVTIGLDADGDPITSCVVQWLQTSGEPRRAAQPPRVGKHEAHVLRVYTRLLNSLGDTSDESIIGAVLSELPPQPKGSRLRDSLKRAISSLRSRGELSEV
jgi:KaiC/GvpD/RAD55 family RecA-like ATPase